MASSSRVWFVRQRWDSYFIPAIAVASLVSACVHGAEDWLRAVAGPLLLAGIWLLVRYQTPSQGESVATIVGTPGAVPLLRWLLICTVASIGGIVLYAAFLDGPQMWPLLVGWSITWLILLMVGVQRIENRTRRENPSASASFPGSSGK